MRNTMLTFIPLLFFTGLFAQKTEYGIAFNSGLFSFSGPSSGKYSQINYDNTKNNGYTNNPYGSLAGLCYGLSLNIKRVTKKNLDLGLDLGFETLRSKVNINAVNGSSTASSFKIPAAGTTFLNSHFINLYPYIGHRFSIKKIIFDLAGGLDFAYCLAASEKGNAKAENGTIYITALDRKTINLDIRPRIQLSAGYQKWGFYIGYSYGLTNYTAAYVGGTNECYGRLARFGLTYRVK